MRGPFLLGRMLFGGYFIMSGINHFKQTNQLAQYAGAKGVPKPDAAVRATGAELIAAGASVLLGFKPKLGISAMVECRNVRQVLISAGVGLFSGGAQRTALVMRASINASPSSARAA